jgi:hypothetical protein
MRMLRVTALLLVGVITLAVMATAVAQVRETPPPRYGVAADLRGYPQATPKMALQSAIQAIELNRLDYLAAHLLDPEFVDRQIAVRLPLVQEAADRELRLLRATQRQKPQQVSLAERLPDEPDQFAVAVDQRARVLAFQLLVRDIQATLTELPGQVKDLRRFLRLPEILAEGDTATASHPAVQDRQLFFRKIGSRWYIEDRQQATAAPQEANPGK